MEKFEGNWWVPAPGDLVRLKTFDVPKNLEEAATLRAIHELGLEPGKTYEVTNYIASDSVRGLQIQEVNIQYIAGKTTKKIVRRIPGTPSIDFFERV